MLQSDPSPDRASLGFAEVVLSCFSFLEARGFERVRVEPTFVRYESDRAFVNVYHGRSSYELGVEVGQLNGRLSAQPTEPPDADTSFVIGHPNPEDRFTIWEIARYSGAPEVTESTFFQASSADRVRSLVPKLAELVQRYAGPALQGDATFLERVREMRSEESRRYRKEGELQRVRMATAEAWGRRDFRRVVDLLEPFQGDLTASEVKKLQYAKDQLAG